ncbi:aspartate/glutamate racemase family protein [Vibrio sp. SM6]|uniref:Aspartate/glutamate racemase family protein n=1 Tax=Vibrio agarilyticus TaxID=2726741 RepID=A0A7X8YGJ3_9VIBR|nr:aspartate/glutamate racemase family protein [Vibrio agarilyticus]NLS13028.1 aspartate/glutamate racemase family protein [Vibrio agarilyticus]
MKTIGLLGGMSWESTSLYYHQINEHVKAALGGLHSAKIALYSVDFAEIERLQHQGLWQETADILAKAAQAVEAAGADFLVICTNTMHKVAPEISQQIGIPVLHIADATAMALQNAGVTRVGLLGTRFTMEQDFYTSRLVEHGIDVLVPQDADRERVHQVIYQELCQGRIDPASRQDYVRIIESLAEQGAQAVILGCTEITMLVSQTDTTVPLYDTTAIHAAKAAERALEICEPTN